MRCKKTGKEGREGTDLPSEEMIEKRKEKKEEINGRQKGVNSGRMGREKRVNLSELRNDRQSEKMIRKRPIIHLLKKIKEENKWR